MSPEDRRFDCAMRVLLVQIESNMNDPRRAEMSIDDIPELVKSSVYLADELLKALALGSNYET